MRSPVYRFAVAVIVAGAAVLVAYALTGRFAILAHPPVGLLALGALAVAAEHIPIRLPRQHDDVSLSSAQLFGFAILMMYGPGAAVAVWALAPAVSDLLGRKPPLKVAFNTAQFTVAMAAAGELLVGVFDFPVGGSVDLSGRMLAPILLSAAALWILNQLLAGTVSALAMGISLRAWWAAAGMAAFLVDGLMLAFAPVVFVMSEHGPWLLPLLGAPFLALYWSAREAERRRHEGLHDSLTGLPNRAFFAQQAERALRDAQPGGRAPGVLLLDVDRFKEVNDALGHAAGDHVLQHIAGRLREAVGPDDFIGRFGGDEFAVLRAHVRADEDLTSLATSIRALLDEPIEVSGVHVGAAASIGIARGGDDGVGALIRRADVAMYLAKAAGGVAHYDAREDWHSPERLERLAELRQAIPAGELILHYQPKLSMATGAVDGVEALVRWQHPVHGLLGPAEFIELAESTDLMEPLTMWVLAAALDQVAAWRSAGHDLTIAVNVSAQTLLDRGLAAEVSAMLRERGLDGSSLKLEITERVLMRDPTRSAGVLEELSALGVRVSIDDFGTGYSSLVLLQRLPVHEIKIDGSFVAGLPSSRSETAIVHSIVQLGITFGVEVVAEGVETPAALDKLAEFGCDTAQGYLISRPLGAADLTGWLERRAAPSPLGLLGPAELAV